VRIWQAPGALALHMTQPYNMIDIGTFAKNKNGRVWSGGCGLEPEMKKNYENILTWWRVTRRLLWFSATYCVLITSIQNIICIRIKRVEELIPPSSRFVPVRRKKKSNKTFANNRFYFHSICAVFVCSWYKQTTILLYYYYIIIIIVWWLLCAIPVQQWHLNGTSRTRPRPT